MSKDFLQIGDALKEMMPALEETGRKIQAFKAEVEEKITSVEHERCIDHPENILPVDHEATFTRSWKNKVFTVVYGQCRKCVYERGEAKARAKWLSMGIPKKLLHATLQNFDTKDNDLKKRALEKFKRQVQRGSGFIIALGTWGTGKSHLAAGVIRHIGEGIFVTEHDLIGELRQTYTENSGQDTMVARYRSTKVLVLDELTPDVKGTDISPLLYRVLGYRHDNDLLTVITSNDELEVVKSILGPKLEDRMRENYCIVNFTWESNRKLNQQ